MRTIVIKGNPALSDFAVEIKPKAADEKCPTCGAPIAKAGEYREWLKNEGMALVYGRIFGIIGIIGILSALFAIWLVWHNHPPQAWHPK